MKFSKQLLFLIVFAITIKTSFAQLKNGPTIDSAAPQIFIKESLDKKFVPDILKNKTIVIDFWATWCAPCIAGFPHFNELADKFANNNNIVFATMTDENRDKVELFFKRTQKSLKGLKLLDDSVKTMHGFSIVTIPQSVVVDNNGIVRWKGNTSDLSENIIDSISKKIPLNKINSTAKSNPYIAPDVQKFTNTAKFLIEFNKSSDTSKIDNASGGWGNLGDDFVQINYNRTTIAQFLAKFLGQAPERFIITNEQKGNFKIDIRFSPHGILDSSYANKFVENRPNLNILIYMLSKAFKFNFTVKKEKVSGYNLILIDSVKLKQFETIHSNSERGAVNHASESDAVNGLVEFANRSLQDITISLENYLKKPIQNSLTNNKHYDFTLNVTDIDNANKQLAKYGLQLKETNDTLFEMNYLDFK